MNDVAKLQIITSDLSVKDLHALVNKKTQHGFTPVQLSFLAGATTSKIVLNESTKFLIEHGADPNTKIGNRSFVQIITAHGSEEDLAYLKSHGGNMTSELKTPEIGPPDAVAVSKPTLATARFKG